MLNVGDILVCSWGYSMTLVDFYKVLSITPSGKSCKLALLKDKMAEHDGYGQAGKVVPTDEIDTDHAVLTRRISNHSFGGIKYNIVKIENGQYAHKWDGKPVYFNTYD